MSPSLSSPGLSYDTKFVRIGWELRSSLVGDTILGVQSEPACIRIVAAPTYLDHELGSDLLDVWVFGAGAAMPGRRRRAASLSSRATWCS